VAYSPSFGCPRTRTQRAPIRNPSVSDAVRSLAFGHPPYAEAGPSRHPGFHATDRKSPAWAPGLGAQWLWALLCKASVVHAVFVSEFPRLVEVVVHPTITLLSFGVTCRNRPIPTFRQRSDGSSQTIFNALSRMPTYAVFALEDRSGNESRLAQNLASPATGGPGGRPNRWVLRRRLRLEPFLQWSRTIGWWSTEPPVRSPERGDSRLRSVAPSLAKVRPDAKSGIHYTAVRNSIPPIVAVRASSPSKAVMGFAQSPTSCDFATHMAETASDEAIRHRVAAERARTDAADSAAETASAKVSASAATPANQN
jgi:hypothetical protein